jgi:DNA polymerase eta
VFLGDGARVAAQVRLAVFEATGYVCSVGIAHNKLFSKLGSGLNKPSQQTLFPFARWVPPSP